MEEKYITLILLSGVDRDSWREISRGQCNWLEWAFDIISYDFYFLIVDFS